MREIDQFYLNQPEPIKGTLLFMRHHILDFDQHITEAWKYRMPFFCYKGKMLCFLWVHKKNGLPYLGIVKGTQINHPDLLAEKRAKMKILLINPQMDIPVETVSQILKTAIALY